MAVPLRLSDAVDLYDEAIQRVFDGTYKAAPETYKLLCNVGTTNLYLDKSSAFTGFSKAKQMAENESVLYESPDQGMDQTWTQREFGLGFAVTKRLWQFGQKNIIKRLPAKLAAACVRKRESDVQDYLYESFYSDTLTDADGNSITITGGDGFNLIYKSHSREDGGTAINNVVTADASTYNMDLAEDALDAAETYVKPKILDGKGQVIALNYTRLLVPPALVPTAQRLMKTDRKVGSADWDVNVYKGKYDIVEMPYFNSSGGAYWLLYDPTVGSEGLQMVWSQPVKMEGPELVFDTGSFKYKVTMQYDLRHNDFRAYQGSRGDNTDA